MDYKKAVGLRPDVPFAASQISVSLKAAQQEHNRSVGVCLLACYSM
jgi:hypothetical protein